MQLQHHLRQSVPNSTNKNRSHTNCKQAVLLLWETSKCQRQIYSTPFRRRIRDFDTKALTDVSQFRAQQSHKSAPFGMECLPYPVPFILNQDSLSEKACASGKACFLTRPGLLFVWVCENQCKMRLLLHPLIIFFHSFRSRLFKCNENASCCEDYKREFCQSVKPKCSKCSAAAPGKSEWMVKPGLCSLHSQSHYQKAHKDQLAW